MLSVLLAVAWAEEVQVHQDELGYKLQVEGEDFFVRGMNWGYVPIGTNYAYSLWVQPDEFIETVLHREMALLQAAGVNAIRLYDDVPPEWVTWIWENYGIYTMINPLFGRYGLTIDGAWVAQTNYEDERTREVILEQTLASVERFKDTEGVLFYLLGNENNYGLHWSSFEIEALPEEDQNDARARALYSLYGEAVDAIHALDSEHPVAICNGDLQYIDIIAEEVPNMDIFGTNVYRGPTARDLYAEVEAKLGIPIVYAEFGADAFNARTMQEDPVSQARYVHSQWEDIYVNAWGSEGVGNAIGGFQFQWADGWWKYRQTTNLDIHDTNASWPNGGYADDFVEGQNNMNEEWFGIMAKTPPNAEGHYDLQPRPAYFTLQAIWALDPYDTSPDAIADHFGAIRPADYMFLYEASVASAQLEDMRRAYVSDVRLELDTFASGADWQNTTIDDQQSVYIDLRSNPAPGFTSEVGLNLLGHVAQNRINEIQYETRGRGLEAATPEGGVVELDRLERLAIHHADFEWDMANATLNGFYRTGHYHWAHKGDIFGLYREAYYGPNLDTYYGLAPIGLELTGKGKLDGLSLAAGPQLWWGANPAVLGSYGWDVGGSRWTLTHQEDLAQRAGTVTLNVIPEQKTRVTTLAIQTNKGPFGVQLGGVVGGTPRLGQGFTYAAPTDDEVSYSDSGYHVLSDEIRPVDTLGGRARVTYEKGNVHVYAQGGYRGLVADTGGDPELLFTGWTLKESARGNNMSALGGVVLYARNWQIGPNVKWQKPLIGPMPRIDGSYDPATGWYVPGTSARNVLADPFVVLDNREETAFELMLAWDPTPGTWMWNWDSEFREDAPFAFSTNAVYRIHPTSIDGNLGFTADGNLFAFAAGPPAANVWDVNTRFFINPSADTGLIARTYVGQGQATGDDSRLVTRYGGEVQMGKGAGVYRVGVKVDDWGPYDYHRVFNLTYPLQVDAHVSTGLQAPPLEGTTTRIGLEGSYRSLDEYSPLDNPVDNEWEIRSVVHVSL